MSRISFLLGTNDLEVFGYFSPQAMHTGSTHLLHKSNCSFSKMEGPNICWTYWSCISHNEMLLRHKWCVIWNLPSSLWGRDPNLYCGLWNHHLWLVVHPRWSPQHSSLARKNISTFPGLKKHQHRHQLMVNMLMIFSPTGISQAPQTGHNLGQHGFDKIVISLS